MIDFLYNSCRFFAHESCGQCTPCREGTHWAMMMLDRIQARPRPADGPRSAGRDRRHDRHHARHHDLRPGRRRRLAHQDDDPQVPRRVGGLHPADQSAGATEYRRPGRRIGGTLRTEPRIAKRNAACNSNPHPLPLPPMPKSPSTDAKSNCPTGRRLNAIEAAGAAGIEIPHYCYHPGLTRGGQLPHVPGRGRHAATPRPARSACSRSSCPAATRRSRDGMVIVTNSEKVQQARAMVEEDLLLAASDRLPDLRQGGRMPVAGLPFPLRAAASGGPTCSPSPAAAATWAT